MKHYRITRVSLDASVATNVFMADDDVSAADSFVEALDTESTLSAYLVDLTDTAPHPIIAAYHHPEYTSLTPAADA